MLIRDVKILQIWGANTDVGKTIVSTLLCKALSRRTPDAGLLYLKPVSTGPLVEADDRHLSEFAKGVTSECIVQFRRPVSPHIAARDATSVPTDDSIVSLTRQAIERKAQRGYRNIVVETAGGVLSPGPSGRLQADLYRPLRLPSILVGDHRLGGISTSISAFESLHLRGYDIDALPIFDNQTWGNFNFLQQHFQQHEIEVIPLPLPPTRKENAVDDRNAMLEYYERATDHGSIRALVDLLTDKHFRRISSLMAMPILAETIVWHPFRQHGIPQDIIAIDSAYDDHFQALVTPKNDPGPPNGLGPARNSPTDILAPLFDGSASWWTQGLGHGNPQLALTAAHAAGRYGHVMFASAIHQPALNVADTLLQTLQNPRLSRVFFTDNGSTGMEVAIKMALRASSARYGWSKDDGKGQLGILGVQGSYHGDTIGVMNSSEPSPFNEKVDWYKPWGHWFEPPTLAVKDGAWRLEMPKSIGINITAAMEIDERVKLYEAHIAEELVRLTDAGWRFGALLLEPIIMGAGGMILVDPAFHRALITCVRKNYANLIEDKQEARDARDWKGLPVVADEVFTGLYRLGRSSAMSFLSNGDEGQDLTTAADISVHAKLLTGGLLPLAITTASEFIFNTFLSDKKQDALLHGHSYTAHAVGCAVATHSLREMTRMNSDGTWDQFKGQWTSAIEPVPGTEHFWSFWSPSFVSELSCNGKVEKVYAVGCVFAVTLKSAESGYTSNAAAELQQELLRQSDNTDGIHSRVLGMFCIS